MAQLCHGSKIVPVTAASLISIGLAGFCHGCHGYFLIFYFLKKKNKYLGPPLIWKKTSRPVTKTRKPTPVLVSSCHGYKIVPVTPVTLGPQMLYFCIIKYMTTYVYQIQGALENVRQELLGFRVFLCTTSFFDSVDVPAEVFDKELLAYMKFRLAVTEGRININRLPLKIQNSLRKAMGQWLDRWVLENLPNGDKQ